MSTEPSHRNVNYLQISHQTGAGSLRLPFQTIELTKKTVFPTSVHPIYKRVPVLRAFQCHGRGSSTRTMERAQRTAKATSRMFGKGEERRGRAECEAWMGALLNSADVLFALRVFVCVYGHSNLNYDNSGSIMVDWTLVGTSITHRTMVATHSLPPRSDDDFE